MKTTTYTVLTPVRHDQVDYAEGGTIDLDDNAASPLLAAGAIALRPPASKAGKKGDETT